jgi:hypothetical protein
MSEETKTIKITAYRDSKGNPTCAKNFETGQVCLFYRTQRLGCNETCALAERAGKYNQSMSRRENGNGSLIPLSNCPIWSQEIKNI